MGDRETESRQDRYVTCEMDDAYLADPVIHPIVLLQYQGTVANLRKSLDGPVERSATLIAAYQPESDLIALIERYRTGSFRPDPRVYESVAHDECDVVFGIDLRKWAAIAWDNQEKKELIPPIITALFDGLNEAYKRLPDDAGGWCVVPQAI